MLLQHTLRTITYLLFLYVLSKCIIFVFAFYIMCLLLWAVVVLQGWFPKPLKTRLQLFSFFLNRFLFKCGSTPECFHGRSREDIILIDFCSRIRFHDFRSARLFPARWRHRDETNASGSESPEAFTTSSNLYFLWWLKGQSCVSIVHEAVRLYGTNELSKRVKSSAKGTATCDLWRISLPQVV